MTSHTGLFAFLRRSLLPMLCLGMFYYTGYHLVEGDRGLLSWVATNEQLEAKQAELDKLRAQREALERRVALLHPDHMDPDMLDERARAVLGLAQKNEYVIFLDKPVTK